jgi:hypothetical protein
MMKKALSFVSVLLLCLTASVPVLAKTPAAGTPGLSEIYAANRYDSWHSMYSSRCANMITPNADGITADASAETMYADASGNVCDYYSDTDQNCSYFKNNTYYYINNGVLTATLYLKNQVPQIVRGFKGTPLEYTDEEKIISTEKDQNGDIIIKSEMPASAYTGSYDSTIDISLFDKIKFVTVVDGKTLLFRKCTASGAIGDQTTLLNDMIYTFGNVKETNDPPYVNAIKNAAETRTVTVVTADGASEAFTVPKGCGIIVNMEDGCSVYEDENYTALDTSDPDRLNQDRTIYYLPEK